uniref:UBR-type domain-containing protein n=1 Tax=Caenorhabditis tropicalis TaxID=1561998 RepID=A0A1I7T442_9PELO
MEKKDDENSPIDAPNHDSKNAPSLGSKATPERVSQVGLDDAPKAASEISEEKSAEAEEEVVTIEEYFEDMHQMEEAAEMLFATQDPSVCTYPEGYKPRQTVFSCLTCTPAPQMAGICYGCSLNCHVDHEIVELYTKRKFKCDCGNSKFGEKKCSLYDEKDSVNEYNLYNHNYHGKFCTCEVYYPEDDQVRELVQCEVCEDWFHHEHMPSKSIGYEDEGITSETASFICTPCVKKLPFLTQIQQGKDVLCHSKLTPEQLKLDEGVEPSALMISHFRQKLCKCADCARVYDMADCEYLLDTEDDMATFEKESKEKVAAVPKPTEADEMRELVQELGMEGAQHFYAGVNNFKRKFAEFMGSVEEGKTISVEDVKRFSESLKRPRMED